MIHKLGEKLGEFIIPHLIHELQRQGHELTGALINSLEVKTKEQTDSLTVEFLMLKYGLSLNYGIKPKKIPYTIGGKPRGGTSKYIQGLISFAIKRFHVDKKRATQIAFAIAYKHKKEGYPLTRKIAFIDITLEADKRAIQSLIRNYYEVVIELLIKEHLTFTQKA